jgi:nucleoid-associated protein YgaU
MARSRYAGTPVLSGSHYATWRQPLAGRLDTDLLDGVETFEYTFQIGDRMDTLAARFLGDDRYYWVIALVNNIVWPLGVTPGTVLLIPRDGRQVLDKLMR